MADKIYDEPSHVTAKKGDVVVKGPDGVDVALTPDAAAETSQRLLEGAMDAQGQRVETKRETEARRARHPK